MINVIVDKKSELLGIMLLISNYNEQCPELIEEMGNKEYRNKILNQFSQYKNEKTIKLLNRIIHRFSFNYDAPIYLISELNDDFSFSNLPSYPFKERLNSSPIVIEFLKSLKDFSKKINFDKFYYENKSFYNIGINQIEQLIKDYQIVEFLTEFYKTDFKDVKFTINLMYYATHGNYGINVNNNFICNQCLRPPINNTVNFIDSVDNTLTLYVHEFSHSVINPLTDKYSNIKIDVFNDIFDKMKNMAYIYPETIINEHIVRSVEIIFLEKYFNEDYVEKWKNEYMNIGFKYINNVYEKLNYYIKNQKNYKNFEEFFPNILEVFK